MGNDLHGRAEVFSAALFIKDVPVDLACGEIGIPVEVLVDEALVMTKIEVGFCAVLGDIDLAVLIGAHGTGIDIDVGIELLRCDCQSARFEQPAERCGGYALAKSRYYSACYKDVFSQFSTPPYTALAP